MYTDIHSYLDSIFPEPETKSRVLTMLAGALYGYEEYRKVFIFKGSGGNGKSVFMKIIALAYPTIHLSNLSKIHGTDELARAKFAFYSSRSLHIPEEFINNLYYGFHRKPHHRERFHFGGTLIVHSNKDIKTMFPHVCTIEFTERFNTYMDIDIERLAVQLRKLLLDSY